MNVERYDIIRCVLGLLLLSACALKAYEVLDGPTKDSAFFTSRSFLVVAIEVEFALAVMLLIRVAPTTTWMATCFCFCVFLCIAACKVCAGESSCGCFGRVMVPPSSVLCLDACALATLLWSQPGREHASENKRGSRRGVLAIGIWLSVGIPAGYAMMTCRHATMASDGVIVGDSRIVLLEPEKWLGARLPIAKYVDIGDDLMRGRWRLILYNHNCPRCQAVFANYSPDAVPQPSSGGAIRLAVVELPPYGDGGAVGGGQIWGRLADAFEWFAATPVEVELNNGRVLAVRSGAPRHEDPRE